MTPPLEWTHNVHVCIQGHSDCISDFQSSIRLRHSTVSKTCTWRISCQFLERINFNILNWKWKYLVQLHVVVHGEAHLEYLLDAEGFKPLYMPTRPKNGPHLLYKSTRFGYLSWLPKVYKWNTWAFVPCIMLNLSILLIMFLATTVGY